VQPHLTFTPDGRALVVVGQQEVRLWDLATGTAMGQPSQQGVVYGMAISPDGKTIVTASQGDVAQLWDTTRGRPRGEPLRHQGPVYAVAFSPDGSAVLTGSADNTARVWDAATGKPIGPPLRHAREVWNVAFTPDSRALLTRSGDHKGPGSEACLWRRPAALDAPAERLKLWTEVTLGQEVDASGAVLTLDGAAVRQRWQRLQELGGPPPR
jgi:WD40 repeat protein